jgi:hypothetical protein
LGYEDEGTLTYNNVMLRKRMFVPTKSEDHVDLSKVSNVRTTKGKYTNGDDFIITDWKQPGAQRALSNHWSGTTTFYIEGKAPELPSKVTEPPKVLEPIGSAPPASNQRKERKYKGSSKPDYIDSHSWTSMSPSLRKHMIKIDKEQKEKEKLAAMPVPPPDAPLTVNAAATSVPDSNKVEFIQDLLNDVYIDI